MYKGAWSLVKGFRKIDVDIEDDVNDDKKAQFIIVLHLTKDLIHHIYDIFIAKEMWESLEKIYGAKDKNSKIASKIKFYDLNM